MRNWGISITLEKRQISPNSLPLLAIVHEGKSHFMDPNLVIAVAGLVVAIVGSIGIPLYIHKDAQRRDKHH